ncbi:MAG: hypothetical protein LC104_21860 [Bacteroidales bacterium]|nr:hypothetical protein [Bacteroidales bacterium]
MPGTRALLMATLAVGAFGHASVVWAVEPDFLPLGASPVVPLTAEMPTTDVRTEPLMKSAFDPCPPPNCGYFIAEAGVLLMQARFDNNMAFGLQRTTNRSTGAIPPGSPGTRLTQRLDIDHSVVVAPEVTLGFVNAAGLGARVHYWYFREGTDQVLNGGAPGVNSTLLYSASPLGLGFIDGTSAMEVTSKLNVQVLDTEAIYVHSGSRWNVLFAGGVRIARIDQSYNAFVPQSSNNTLLSNNTFHGAGPTLAVEVRHPVCCACLNLYGKVRGSMVYGEANQSATRPDQNLAAQENRVASIGIAEMELGMEYNKIVRSSQLFGQVGVVAQNWSGAGSASRSSVNVLPGGSFVGASYTGDSDINFLGLAVRLGVNY